MTRKWTVRVAVGIVVTVATVVAMVAGVAAFTRGNVNKAREIALRLQASALANPNPVATAAQAAQPASVAVVAKTAVAGSHSTAPAAARSISHSTTTTATQASASSPTTAPAAGNPSKTSSAGAAPAGAPWRQPTVAEVNEAIVAVNNLLPFFTPTPDEIASAGIQVCIALDQGQSYAQVTADALNMVGAGAYASMIPSSVPAVAIQTLVALYCPANAAKLN